VSKMGEEKGEGKSERIYTIPLRAVKKAPRWKRSNRAITLIREFLERHTKSDYIVLDSRINEQVWARGSQKPPSKIRVKVTEEEDVTKAELVE
jgi:large subunit ribosomal protein L31e